MYSTHSICLLLLVKIVAGRPDSEHKVKPEGPVMHCPKNQTLSNCPQPSTCQESCFGPPISCLFLVPCSNSTECVCKKDYVRVKVDGRCIHKSECAKLCKRHEEYTESGSACPETCNNTAPNDCWNSRPIKTCQCKNGYVRRTAESRCILRDHCKSGD